MDISLVQYLVLVVVLRGSAGQEIDQTPAIGRKGIRCYDEFNRPQRCIPEFENAAFNVHIEATNTCGENGDVEYCIQTGITGLRKSCDVCYPNQHDSRYLTDFHNSDNPTWWQSQSMLEGVTQVNLTIKFGKSFDITYVRLWFFSPRPESFAIYKKTTENSSWVPYQFYSATCRDTYNLPESTHTRKGEETRALCTSEYSDISPLRGGNVAFGTLEGRPSAYQFDDSPELQDWVTATELMITLDRLNTFGDEVFGDSQVLRSYFHAIADVAVGARCKCNGHASDCITSTALDGSSRRVCKCEHNTAGPDCNECLPFYNDAPWARASARNANECKQCNCNGFSNRCIFDEKLYQQTGHGGHCLDCGANRDGPNCERCRPNYFMTEDGTCLPCGCNDIGSRTLQCNSEGKCQCKPGVGGDKCDHCEANHYDFSTKGCKSCGCSEVGSAYNQPACDSISGTCYCKENVEGKQCGECKPGFFNLDLDNDFGCTPCFCYSHSSQCTSARGYSKYTIESNFAKSAERWYAEDQEGRNVEVKYEGISQSIGAHALDDEVIYFYAPDRFLGDQRASYNQLLQFSLRVGDNRALPTATDIILEGNGLSITNAIFAQRNKLPTIESQEYKFRLHEHPDFSWQPRLSSRDFISLLTNLTAIKIKGTYAPGGVGFLDDVKLETASRGVAGHPALWLESCQCPDGYVGQYCESCAPGFRHSPAHGGPFMPCIPCDCNNHASLCDSETGRCICQHNTIGENCDLCARGYYGNALAGTPQDCQPCGCPNGGACIQIDNDVFCTECPTGYTGNKCDLCTDGYFGDPSGRFGTPTPCQICECNMNIDTNAVGNCNTTTGECLKCIHNTGGQFCDVCLPGYYGDALVLPKGDCKRCECYPVGTTDSGSGEPICDSTTGSCHCKPHVIGRNCDQCEEGFYNLQSGEGCQSCNCDPTGSLNQTCNLYTGQCFCRPGVTGLRCDHCEIRKYGFSTDGCKDCDCDRIGSKDLQCDNTGQCPCLDNVEGRRCDRCKENKHDRQKGCINCPDCYNLVQHASRSHNTKLDRLTDILDEIERRPTVIADDEFPAELEKLQEDINDFHDKVIGSTGDNSIIQQVQDIQKRGKEVERTLSEIDENIAVTNKTITNSNINQDHSDVLLQEAEDKIAEIENNFEAQGRKALENAWNRSQIVGQQSEKMTEIAQEAREKADVLDTRADDLVGKAKEAKNKSIEAYETAKHANTFQSTISDDARQMRSDLASAEVKLNRTSEWIKQVKDEAVKAKNDALALLNEVNNLVVPQIDIPGLKKKSVDLKDLAFELGNKTDALFRDAENLTRIIDEKNEYGAELITRAYDQQDETDKLLDDIHSYKNIADDAINRWNKILNETESIYKDLKDFDSETQKRREEAEEALKTIKDIEMIITETIQKMTEAQGDLLEAEENAGSSFNKARDANYLAKNASEKADQIKKDAEKLSENATRLTDEAELMFDRLGETETKLNNLLELAQSNATLANEAKEKVGRAGKETNGVSTKVKELLGNVQEILTALENSPEINDSELDQLEEAIRIAEEQVKAAKLDEKLESLQSEHKLQNTLIDQYKIDITRLQKDVENIEQIVKALPDGCFKRVELEP